MDEGRLRLIVREEIRRARVVDPDPLGPDNIRLRWRDWTPAYTNLTVGDGLVVARYQRVGRTVNLHFTFTLGSTSSIGTNPIITLPIPPADGYTVLRNNIGGAYILDDGTTAFMGSVRVQSATEMSVGVHVASATHTTFANITATVPMTWTTSDALAISATFEAAA